MNRRTRVTPRLVPAVAHLSAIGKVSRRSPVKVVHTWVSAVRADESGVVDASPIRVVVRGLASDVPVGEGVPVVDKSVAQQQLRLDVIYRRVRYCAAREIH